MSDVAKQVGPHNTFLVTVPLLGGKIASEEDHVITLRGNRVSWQLGVQVYRHPLAFLSIRLFETLPLDLETGDIQNTQSKPTS